MARVVLVQSWRNSQDASRTDTFRIYSPSYYRNVYYSRSFSNFKNFYVGVHPTSPVSCYSHSTSFFPGVVSFFYGSSYHSHCRGNSGFGTTWPATENTSARYGTRTTVRARSYTCMSCRYSWSYRSFFWCSVSSCRCTSIIRYFSHDFCCDRWVYRRCRAARAPSQCYDTIASRIFYLYIARCRYRGSFVSDLSYLDVH